MCCLLTVQLQWNLASLCVGFMVNEQALKQFFFAGLFLFLCLSMYPSFFHAPVSLHPLLCASTDQAAHYYVLKL
jgi:hypothetical protein